MTDQPHPPQPHPGPPPLPTNGSHPGPWGQQPGGPPPRQPDALVMLTVQGSVMTSSMVPPTITIDGAPAPSTSSGTIRIPIVSGRHRFEAYAQWLRRYGRAGLDVDVPPNSTVEVYYAPPFHQFTDGAMGLTPQPRKGRGLMIGVLAGTLAIILLIILVAVIAGLS